MGEQNLTKSFRSEAELIDFSSNVARRLRAAECFPLIIGLHGELGAGKTTWARAMLRGLGYTGRVPSPTYTLLEQYAVDGLTVVHLDLYRLTGDAELENLALRDWLAEPVLWLLVEWPERAPQLAARCDLSIELTDVEGATRKVSIRAATALGIEALAKACQPDFNYGP